MGEWQNKGDERMFWDGWQGLGLGGEQNGRGGLCRILTPVLGLKVLYGTMWACTSNLAGRAPSKPIQISGGSTQAKGTNVPLPQEDFKLPLSQCSGSHFGAAASQHQQSGLVWNSLVQGAILTRS